MPTDRSIWSRRANITAEKCSAALPTIATTTAPTNRSDKPMAAAACSIEPTSTSAATAVE